MTTVPNEFRIFSKGVNHSTQGDWLFDDAAAKSVMDDYKKHGVDIMIDLEHLSTDQESNAYDPDARGWCKLELRSGELWAVDVKWTTEGKRRLEERRQRYISPAFSVSKENKVVTSLYNIAICAIPATHDAPALIAASKRTGQKLVRLSIEVKSMEELAKIAEALGLEDGATLEDCLEAIKVLGEDKSAAEEKPEDDKKEEKPPEEDKKEEYSDDDKDGDEDKKEMSKLPPKMQARILADRHTAVTLKARLEKLEKSHEKNEVEILMRDNVDKIPLHLESWAKKQSPEVVREFLKHSLSAPKAKTAPKHESKEEVVITSEDREVARLTATPIADILAHKKKKAEEKKLAG